MPVPSWHNCPSSGVHEDRFNVSQTRGAFRWWDCGELAAEFVAKLPAVTHLDMYGYFTSEALNAMFLHATFPERLRHLHVCPAVEADTMSDMLEKLVSFFPRLHTLDVMFDTTDIQLGIHVKMSVLPFFRPLRMYRSMAVRFRNTENVTWYLRPYMTSVTTYPRLENRQARDLVAFSRGRVDVYSNSHGKESTVYTGSKFTHTTRTTFPCVQVGRVGRKHESTMALAAMVLYITDHLAIVMCGFRRLSDEVI
ncbi:hypothetical protein GHT06_003813 [Daphnia sinensis]|uniref:Uncharacterized protein n=1 Tax=Daphnia sinensis TaxID=1820382 RepID=A0AAD5KDR9_9CRUS|nr:hypothetical protein GHT06_003813 [Daphnia sinensis]